MSLFLVFGVFATIICVAFLMAGLGWLLRGFIDLSGERIILPTLVVAAALFDR